MRILFIIFIIFSLAACSSLTRREVASTNQNELPKECYSNIDSDKYLCAYKLDNLKNEKGRVKLENGYRSKFGFQIHPICFKAYGEKNKLLIIADTEKEFLKAFNKIIKTYETFPELKHWLDEWITESRRTIVSCFPDPTSLVPVYMPIRIGLEFLPKETAEGLEKGGGFDSLSELHQGLIVSASSPSIMSRMNNYSLLHNGMTIHEIFHSTSLNNQTMHNSIENIKYDSEKPCSKNHLEDRVATLSSIIEQDSDTWFQMQDKIKKCGIEKACEELFTSQISNPIIESYSKSSSITKAQAVSVCKSISTYSKKYKLLYEIKNSKDKTAQNNFMKNLHGAEILQEVVKHLNALLPNHSNVITSTMLEMFPQSAKKILSMKGTACFDRLISNENRDLIFQNNSKTFSKEERTKFVFSNDWILNQLDKLFKEVSECNNQEGERLKAYLSELKSHTNAIFSEWTFAKIGKNRFLDIIEDGQSESGKAVMKQMDLFRLKKSYLLKDNLTMSPIEIDTYDAFWAILGKDLGQRYLEFLNKAHPDSSEFDITYIKDNY